MSLAVSASQACCERKGKLTGPHMRQKDKTWKLPDHLKTGGNLDHSYVARAGISLASSEVDTLQVREYRRDQFSGFAN